MITQLIVFLIIIRTFASSVIFYFAFLTLKRIKKPNILSATTGFTILLFAMAIYHLMTIYNFLEPTLNDKPISYTGWLILLYTINYLFVAGFILFNFFVEYDTKRNTTVKHLQRRIDYPITIISILIFIINIIVSLFFLIASWMIFIFLTVCFIFAVDQFVKKFENLMFIKESKVNIWLTLGIFVATASHFLLILGGIESLYLNSTFVIIGCLMMVYAWSKIPDLSELNWLIKLERLFVIHADTSLVLYNFRFRYNKTEAKEKKETDEKALTLMDTDLAGAALGGIGSIMMEIVSSASKLREIDHEDKKIYFTHRESIVCILVTTAASKEFKYRLEMFATSFKQKFSEYLKKFDGETSKFNEAKPLITEFFS